MGKGCGRQDPGADESRGQDPNSSLYGTGEALGTRRSGESGFCQGNRRGKSARRDQCGEVALDGFVKSLPPRRDPARSGIALYLEKGGWEAGAEKDILF